MPAERILLVEGVDDYHVILHLQAGHDLRIVDREEIRQTGGIQPLLESLPVQLKASDGGILGVVIDADQDFAARWQSLRACLASAGYEAIPESPICTGTILAPPPETLLPKFGAWLMPDNASRGILEDFLRFLVPEGDVMLPFAEETLRGLPEQRFSANDYPKALIHTWLAWQKEPCRPFGQAITARFLQSGVPEATVFMAWLSTLFSERFTARNSSNSPCRRR